MEGVQKLNKLLIQFVINVLVIMFDPVRRTSNFQFVWRRAKIGQITNTIHLYLLVIMYHLVRRKSNLYCSVQKLDKLLRRTSNLYGVRAQIEQIITNTICHKCISN
jgi:hypothetical protein